MVAFGLNNTAACFVSISGILVRAPHDACPPLKLVSHARRAIRCEVVHGAPDVSTQGREVASQSFTSVDDNKVAAPGD